MNRKRSGLFTVVSLMVSVIAVAGCVGDAGQASASSQRAEVAERTTLSGLIAAHIREVDFTAVARARNPIVDSGGGCNRTLASVDSIERAAVDVLVASSSTTRIIVASPVVRGQVQYRFACITLRAAFTLRADAYVVDGVVVPRIESGALAVEFDSATGRFDNLSVEVPGVPGIIVDQLVALAVPRLADSLSQAVAAEIPPVVNAFLAGPAFTELAASVEDAIAAIDLDAALRAMNPIVDTGGGCSSMRANVSSATHGTAGVVLGPTTDGIATSIAIADVAANGAIEYRILCITGRSGFTVAADARVDGVTTLGVDGGGAVASFQTLGATVDNLQLDVASVPAAIVDLLVPPLADQLTTVIGEQVAQAVPPHVAQFFNDFLSR